MTADAYALVVLSAAGHAWWNFLLKRSGGTQVFIGLSKVAEAVLLAPVLIFGVLDSPAALRELWLLPVVGAALVLANYVLLTAAYRRGDLSLVYPLARGGMLVFLPPLAYLTIGERLDRFGWAAVLVIVAGIVFLQLQRFDRTAAGALGRSVATPAVALALAAALVAAGYTVWDKRAVQLLSPVTYFAAYTVLVGIGYGLLLRRQVPGAEARAEWRRHWRPILEVAVLNSASYLLALAALRTGKASLVIALRQLSIPAGAGLGWWLLGETLPPPRRLGVALVVAGCVLLSLAR